MTGREQPKAALGDWQNAADSVEKGSLSRESASPLEVLAIPTSDNYLAAVGVLLVGRDTRCGIRQAVAGVRPVRHTHDGDTDHSRRTHKPRSRHTARNRRWPKAGE